MGGRDTIDYTLKDRIEVFFKVEMRYLERIGDSDRRDRRTNGEVFWV